MKFFIRNFLLLLFISSCSLFIDRNPKESVEVKTNNGTIIGVEEKDYYSFKGIPFAQPPVGDLRWRAPRDLPNNNAVIYADEYKSSCVQPGSGDFSFSFSRDIYSGDEDCLY